ncbi:MAG: polyprenyl synthetase family protein [Planctomycetota bacterium]
MPVNRTPADLDEHTLAPLADVERELERWIDDAGAGGDLSPALRDAMRYAALGSGKKLRPLLVWHVCHAAGGDPRHALPAAAAVELVHAFSLVHDDLPAMDDDDLRRGRPTLHVHAGEAMAILAGDALFSLAYDALARGYTDATTSQSLILELARGAAGMISGQVFDSLPDADERPEGLAAVERVHRNKTGALIRASCRMGAICAGNADALAPATAYGDALGLMFQAVDDLIDVEQDAEHTGKRTGKDADAGKLTYPGVVGIDETRRIIDRLATTADDAARRISPNAAALNQLTSYLAARDR